jgi:hypothetical protein
MSMPLAGCDTQELHDLNKNPQAVDEIDMAFLFTAAQLSSAGGGAAGDNRIIDWRINIGVAAHAIQHFANAGLGIAPGDKYFNEETGAAWGYLTADIGKNIQEVLKQTGTGGSMEGRHNNLRQATRILRAFNFQRLTDWHGNVPYSQAFQGMDGIYFPEYDTQEFIYTDLLKELSEAVNAFTTNSGSGDDLTFSRQDLFYAGNTTKWKKFGYSLMLRMAMRVAEVAPSMADKYAKEAAAGGVITSNDDNILVAMMNPGALFTNQNGLSRAMIPGDGGQQSWLSETLVTNLQDRNDPRLMIYSGGTGVNRDKTPAAQKGLRNGLDAATVLTVYGSTTNLNTDFAIMNPELIDRDEPYLLMSAAESNLLLAEAAERGFITGDAQAFYNAGVTQALTMYNAPGFKISNPVDATEVADYLAEVPYAGGDAGLEQIAYEIWVSSFLNWWEGWSNYRRTGMPDLTQVNYSGQLGTPTSPGIIPRKLRIPDSEVNNNSANYQSGATLPNEIATKVWWDVKD